jgi:hypothetical protein
MSALNVYQMEHNGHWLGGRSIAIAESEAQAIELTNDAIVEHGCTTGDTKVVRKLMMDKPRCYVIDNGDY